MSEVPQTIRIPRIAIAAPTSHLTGSGYLSPMHSTLPRHTTATAFNSSFDRNNVYTPSYIVDHLPSRRLSEIDSPFYLPSLINNNQNAGLMRNGYSTAPLRIRTDPNSTRFVDTSTDDRHHRRERAATSNEYRDNIRYSNYPATAAAIGTAKLPRLHVETTPPIPFNYISTPPIPAVLPETENRREGVIAETNEEVNTLALFNNSSLAYQRICFLLCRYPALAMTIVSIWMLWGRGLGLAINNNENVAYIVSFTAGLFILIGQIILSSSHHNSYKAANILANFYHFSNIVGILICMTAVVFAAISYQNVQTTPSSKIPDCLQMDPTYMNTDTGKCFTPNERVVFLSVIIGASALIIILFLFSGIYGCVGQSLMKKKRQNEFKKFAETHDNASFRF